MTLEELDLLIRGYKEKQVEDYRKLRTIVYTMVKLMGDGKKIGTPEQFWELPGDKVNQISEDEREDLLKRFAKLPKLGQ